VSGALGGRALAGVAHLDSLAGPLPCRVYVPALRDYPWPRG
jgi:hypothetical protein